MYDPHPAIVSTWLKRIDLYIEIYVLFNDNPPGYYKITCHPSKWFGKNDFPIKVVKNTSFKTTNYTIAKFSKKNNIFRYFINPVFFRLKKTLNSSCFSWLSPSLAPLGMEVHLLSNSSGVTVWRWSFHTPQNMKFPPSKTHRYSLDVKHSPWKYTIPKRKRVFQPWFFRGHVKLRGCIPWQLHSGKPR